MAVDSDPGHPPPFRAPRSSLAMGRRFRLMARSPLVGAGIRPRVPGGFQAVGRDADLGATPESPHEKLLVLPRPENVRPNDLAWGEGRYAADLASEQALFFSMVLPTETAPERKKEAQRLHERALKLFQRVDALGPGGIGDLRAFAEDVRGTLQPVLDFAEACRDSQSDGELQSLAWPSFFGHARDTLEVRLARMESIAAGRGLPSTEQVLAACAALAANARLAARLLDPAETETVAMATDLAVQLVGIGDSHNAEAAGRILSSAVRIHTELARGVESGRFQSALNPILADHMRREALKAVDDLQRSLVQPANSP